MFLSLLAQLLTVGLHHCVCVWMFVSRGWLRGCALPLDLWISKGTIFVCVCVCLADIPVCVCTCGCTCVWKWVYAWTRQGVCKWMSPGQTFRSLSFIVMRVSHCSEAVALWCRWPDSVWERQHSKVLKRHTLDKLQHAVFSVNVRWETLRRDLGKWQLSTACTVGNLRVSFNIATLITLHIMGYHCLNLCLCLPNATCFRTNFS